MTTAARFSPSATALEFLAAARAAGRNTVAADRALAAGDRAAFSAALSALACLVDADSAVRAATRNLGLVCEDENTTAGRILEIQETVRAAIRARDDAAALVNHQAVVALGKPCPECQGRGAVDSIPGNGDGAFRCTCNPAKPEAAKPGA